MHVHMHRETYELTKAIVVLSEIVAWWAGAVEASHGVDTGPNQSSCGSSVHTHPHL